MQHKHTNKTRKKSRKRYTDQVTLPFRGRLVPMKGRPARGMYRDAFAKNRNGNRAIDFLFKIDPKIAIHGLKEFCKDKTSLAAGIFTMIHNNKKVAPHQRLRLRFA